MMLPGCAHRIVEVPVAHDVPIAQPLRDAPPAELTTCAERPAGLPEDPALVAQIPAAIRAGVIRMAQAFGANADRLDRLVNWNVPGQCPERGIDR